MATWEKRRVGRTSLHVTSLGLGTATMGGSRIAMTNEARLKLVDAAWNAGVRYVDTALQGTPKVGTPLTANPGTWTPSGTAFSYQWQVGGAPVGATGVTYTPTSADVGTLTVSPGSSWVRAGRLWMVGW